MCANQSQRSSGVPLEEDRIREDRRGRKWRVGPGGRVGSGAHPRRHGVRGRCDARRPRRHHRRRRRRTVRARRHGIHRLQPTQLPSPGATVPCPRCADGAQRHVVLGLGGRRGVRVSRPPGRVRRAAGQPAPPSLPAHDRRDRTVHARGQGARGGRLDALHGRVPGREGDTPRPSATTSCCRWWRASGRRICGRCSPTPRRPWRASSTTTACWTWATVPSGEPCSGGSREYVRRVASSLTDVRTGTAGHVDRASARRGRAADGRRRHGAIRPRGPGDPCRHLARRSWVPTRPAWSDRCWVRSATRRTERCCIATPRSCPSGARAWSSWNYLARDRGLRRDRPRCLAHLLDEPGCRTWTPRRPVFVTLNPTHEPRDVHASFIYHHPQYDRDAVRGAGADPISARRAANLVRGSYCGYGFHEDGLRSGLQVAAALGAPAPWWREDGAEPRLGGHEPAAIGMASA